MVSNSRKFSVWDVSHSLVFSGGGWIYGSLLLAKARRHDDISTSVQGRREKPGIRCRRGDCGRNGSRCYCVQENKHTLLWPTFRPCKTGNLLNEIVIDRNIQSWYFFRYIYTRLVYWLPKHNGFGQYILS